MNFKSSWSLPLSLFAGAVASVTFASSATAEIREQAFRFASVQAAEHPFSRGAQMFADLVVKKSGGKMKARLFTGGTLGGDAQVISSLQGGTVDATFVSTGLISPMDKNFGIYYMPMAFSSGEEADKVVDGPFGKKLLDRLKDQGLVGLAYWEHGFRSVTNNKHPITKVEDFSGLKLRTIQIPLFVELYKELGTNPVPMGFSELFTALEQRAVDGQETALPTIQSARFDEVQKYLSLTKIVYDPLVVLFSKKTWDRLNADEQKVLGDAAREATEYQRKLNRETEVAMVKNSPKKGMAVNDLTDVERNRIRERLQPVIDRYSKEYDKELLAEFWSEIEKARKAVK